MTEPKHDYSAIQVCCLTRGELDEVRDLLIEGEVYATVHGPDKPDLLPRFKAMRELLARVDQQSLEAWIEVTYPVKP